MSANVFELYEKYVGPVEADHEGEYVAVAKDGRMIFGLTLHEVVRRAPLELGVGTRAYKVGERAVGYIR
jgi:hypothetical protein